MLLEAELVAEVKPLIFTVCRLFLLDVEGCDYYYYYYAAVLGAFVRDSIVELEGLFD